jgi:glyoxylase-like metal-dependent hydrolase (beta-lactamase superfamily II)
MFETLQVGTVRIDALLDGDDELGESIATQFPDIPEVDLLAWRERAPGVHGPSGGWRLRSRAWLVHHPGGLLLMDSGLGVTDVTMSWFPRPGVLQDVLAEAGVAPHHVDTLVISHTHDDHVGGLVTADGEPAFPNARHVIQQAELETARADAREDEEDAAIWETLLRPIEEAGLFEVLDGDTRLNDELQLHHAPGHTPGHQVLRIASEGRRALLSADAWNHPGQFPHPDWPSGPDRHHAEAAATRRALLAELFSHPGTVLAPTHLAEAFGQVVNGKDGLAAWRPLS